MEAYQQLEYAFASFNDLDPVGMVACSSGTSALHLALESLGLPLGSQVIVPDFTMVACARAVAMAGLTPVFVDCGTSGSGWEDPPLPVNLNLNIDLVAKHASRRVRAIMPVHIYGRRVNMDHLVKVADGMDWCIVEDLAEAHGIRPHPDSDAACWSFYRNKIIAGEEGGAVWFRNPKAAELARCLRSMGFGPKQDYQHVPRGHNYRMSNAHASLILKSLRHYEVNLMARRWIESTYERECPESWKMPKRDAPWVYDICPPLQVCVDGSLYIDRPIKAIKKVGIQARHAFKPMHTQEEFKDHPFIQRENYATPCPSSCLYAALLLYLPLTPGAVTERQVASAFEILRDFFPEKA